MKKILFTLSLAIACCAVKAQNTDPWPSTGNIGIGTQNPLSLLDVSGGGLVVGANAVTNNVDGGLSIGNLSATYTPTTSNCFSTGSTLILSAHDYSTIAFHHSGLRVDFIRSGNGTIQIGYDGGWGQANVGLPNGIWSSNGNVGIGTTTPNVALHVNGIIKTILDPNFQSQNVVSILPIGYDGITGAQNWAIRGVYQYSNGVGNNANRGDLDIIKSMNGNTVLGTKTDGTALGNVLIGIMTQKNSSYILDVNGTERADGIVVNADGADFVFEPTYKLYSLPALKEFIDQNHHLSEIPSAKEMQKDGLNVGENQVKLLQKVEELTLYLIDNDKKERQDEDLLAKQQQEIEQLKQQVNLLIRATLKN